MQIRRAGEKMPDQNERFRKHLKRHKFEERKFRDITLDIAAEIDCTTCPNCCREATV